MPSQSLRLAAVCGHDVHVEVAGILAAKRDPSAVRRKMRVRCLSLKTGQASRAATGTRHNPDVVRVSETDLSGADCRRAQQSSLTSVTVLRSDFWRENQKTEQQDEQDRNVARHAIKPPGCGLLKDC